MSDEMKVARYYFVDNHPERYDEDGEWVKYTDYERLQQQLAAAREELSAASDLLVHRFEQLQAAEADAARYRWLRDQFETYSVNGRTSAGYRLWDKYEIPAGADGGWDAKFDAAIDAASGATLQRDRQP